MSDTMPGQKTAGSSPTGLHGCPSAEELIAFNRGTLPLVLITSVAAHVKECPQCESNLSTLQRDGETRAIQPLLDSPADHQVNVQIEDSGQMILVDLPIDFSRTTSNRLAKGSRRILEAPLQLGQYRLMEKIGQGGMGVVYKAWHDRLRREVAIKLLPLDQFNDPIGIERMQREMAAAGTLRHPNIVYATDAGEAEGVHFLVMEHVQGIDLGRLVSRLGPLPLADACELARQAAVGLEHIDEQGLVHRDVKPSNLMLAVDGTVKILDLGLALLKPDELDEEQLTRKNYMLGTADYVAPEQAVDSHTADIRADIYSLGCTLFKLLTGEAVYSGENYGNWTRKIAAHREAELPDLAGPRQEIPAELQLILRRALAKNVRDRYQSPGDFAAALESHAQAHDLPGLLRQAGLTPVVPAFQRVPSPSGTARAGSLKVTAPASAIDSPVRRKLSRLQLVAMATFLAFVVCGAVLAVNSFNSKMPTVSDAKEIGFNAIRGESSLAIDPRIKTITVNSPESRQFVALGHTVPVPKRFATTIRQSGVFWDGNTGFFLGYREEPLRGLVLPGTPLRKGAVLQVIFLTRCDLPGEEPKLRWERKLVQIDPVTQGFNLLSRSVAVSQSFPANQAHIDVVIRFDASGISSFKMNEQEIPEISCAAANQLFGPQDQRGPMGIYNYGKYDSCFSNFDFSSLEKE